MKSMLFNVSCYSFALLSPFCVIYKGVGLHYVAVLGFTLGV